MMHRHIWGIIALQNPIDGYDCDNIASIPFTFITPPDARILVRYWLARWITELRVNLSNEISWKDKPIRLVNTIAKN